MNRQAILLGNTAESDDPSLSVSASVLQRKLRDIENVLNRLGKYSFNVLHLRNQKRQSASNEIHRTVQRYSQSIGRSADSCLLFYYFGHAVVREKELCFVFKDSKSDQMPTMLSFQDIVKTVLGFHIPSVIFVLDCCYAGAAEYSVPQFSGARSNYYLLASTLPTQKAIIENANVPFGAFSNFLFAGLRDPDAAAHPTKIVTPQSWFTYAAKLTKEKFHQIPYRVDGGLSEMTLAEVSPRVVIFPGYNPRAPKKCFYSKTRWICTSILLKGFHSPERLYGFIKNSNPTEMLTPVKLKNSVVYRPITQTRLNQYLFRLRSLGLLEDETDLHLTMKGEKLVSRSGKDFNVVLIDLVSDAFKKAGTSLDELDSIVRFRLSTIGIPNASSIYDDATQSTRMSMSLEWFTVLIDLLAQIGFFRYSSRRTYFPY